MSDIIDFPGGEPPEPPEIDDRDESKYAAILDLRDHVDALAAVLRMAKDNPNVTAADLMVAFGPIVTEMGVILNSELIGTTDSNTYLG